MGHVTKPFKLTHETNQTLMLPKGAVPLYVSVDVEYVRSKNPSLKERKHTPILWAVVDSSAELAEYKFQLFGTNEEMDEVPFERTHVGSYSVNSNRNSFHLWWLTELSPMKKERGKKKGKEDKHDGRVIFFGTPPPGPTCRGFKENK